jgi:hypothetical protein
MESCFWPIKEGTWRERVAAAIILLELLGLWAGCYLLAWLLQR